MYFVRNVLQRFGLFLGKLFLGKEICRLFRNLNNHEYNEDISSLHWDTNFLMDSGSSSLEK